MNLENIDFFDLSCSLLEFGNSGDGEGDDAVVVWFVYDANQYCIQVVVINDFVRNVTGYPYVNDNNISQFELIEWICGTWAEVLRSGVSAATVLSQYLNDGISLPDGLGAIVILASRNSIGKTDLAVVAKDDYIEEENLKTALQRVKQRFSRVLLLKKSKKS